MMIVQPICKPAWPLLTPKFYGAKVCITDLILKVAIHEIEERTNAQKGGRPHEEW
jgi:hypothetical protein